MSALAAPTHPLAAPEITPEIARLVLGHFRSGNPEHWRTHPSVGEKTILDLFTQCDAGIGQAVGRGLPGFWAAICTIRRSGGTAELEAIAEAES